MKKSVYIKILEAALEKPEGFTKQELNKALNLKDWEQRILDRHFDAAWSNRFHVDRPKADSLFHCLSENNESTEDEIKYIVSSNAEFMYIDYLELKAARQTAKDANKNANHAHRNAKLALIAAIIIPLLTGWEGLVSLLCNILKVFS